MRLHQIQRRFQSSASEKPDVVVVASAARCAAITADASRKQIQRAAQAEGSLSPPFCERQPQ